MSLGRKDISKNIVTKVHISSSISNELLESFLNLIKFHSIDKTVKISNFGKFYTKLSPRRIGRNPLTKEEFEIKERLKPSFLSAKNIKKIIN